MKAENGGLLPQFDMGRDSAEIYDFLYVDRSCISALYAQLFPEGVLTSVKKSAQQNFVDEKNVGTGVKVLKFETKSAETGAGNRGFFACRASCDPRAFFNRSLVPLGNLDSRRTDNSGS